MHITELRESFGARPLAPGWPSQDEFPPHPHPPAAPEKSAKEQEGRSLAQSLTFSLLEERLQQQIIIRLWAENYKQAKHKVIQIENEQP